MDPDSFVYCQKKGKLVRKKIRKLKRGDMILAVTKDWSTRIVKVKTVFERIIPSLMVSKYTFKNGDSLIASDYHRLTRLYDAPYNNDEPLHSGTYMTFRYVDGNQQVGMTELSSIEGLNNHVLVRLYALNCEYENNLIDGTNCLVDGIIVNGIPVCSFN